MDMMEIRHRVLMGRKVDDKPWLDYPLPVFEFNKQPLICSDGTQWEWKDNGNNGYWECPRTVQPTMIKAWFREAVGVSQNLFSNNSSNYEAWQNGTSFNFRSKNIAYRTLKANDLYPVTFDMITGVISRSDGSVITTIPTSMFPFLLNCIAGRAGASNNNQNLYGIQVWL